LYFVLCALSFEFCQWLVVSQLSVVNQLSVVSGQ